MIPICTRTRSTRRQILAAGASALVLPWIGKGIAQPRKLRVATTFTILQDMASNVAGDAADVVSITKPGAEIHDYQPTPQDVVRAQDAGLVLWNGMNLERWFEKFFGNLGDKRQAVLTEGITPLSISGGAYDGKPNPHAWMSAANAVRYIENIRQALAAADPANAATYASNAAAYTAAVRALDAPLKARLAAVPEAQRWLVTSEGAFSYLAADLGWREAFLWPINAEEQGSPQQVRRLIDLVRRNKIPVVFSESTVSDRPARQVARETGARYGGVLYVDSLSDAKGPVPTYLKLMETTVDTIAKGFRT
jgi:manganese/iron transport system substrate-binding protein